MSGRSFKRARRAIRPIVHQTIEEARQDILNRAPWWRHLVYRWGWKEPLTTWCRAKAAKAEKIAVKAMDDTARKVVHRKKSVL
jgi:hypothetical protein